MAISHLSQVFVQKMEQRLLKERARLQQELAGLRMHTEVGTQTDENAEEVELDEVNQNLIGRIKTDLEKISSALRKIEEGTYGIDDQGRSIAKERLEVLPWADKAI